MAETTGNENNYDINTIVDKIKSGNTLDSEELVWFSKQIANSAIDWSGDNSWIKDFLPQLRAEMESQIKEGEESQTLRDSERSELFRVSQVQRRTSIGRLGISENNRKNAQVFVAEANQTLVSELYLANASIHGKPLEGVNLDSLIKQQEDILNNISWFHPQKKLRLGGVKAKLELLQEKAHLAEQRLKTRDDKINKAEETITQTLKSIAPGPFLPGTGRIRITEEICKMASEYQAALEKGENPEIPRELQSINYLGDNQLPERLKNNEDGKNRIQIIAEIYNKEIKPERANIQQAKQEYDNGGPEAKKDIDTYLASIHGENLPSTSLWKRIRHPFASRKPESDLKKLMEKLPTSAFKADGTLMTGLDAEIESLKASLGFDKKKNKATKKKIERLSKLKELIVKEHQKRNAEYDAKKEKLLDVRREHVKEAQEDFSNSQQKTHERDTELQASTLFSQTLQALEAEGFDVKDLKEQYHKQVKNRELDEFVAGMTPEQQEILQALVKPTSENKDPQKEDPKEKDPQKEDPKEKDPQKEDSERGGEPVVGRETQETDSYTPLKNIEYTHSVDGKEQKETYNGDAVSHSTEENRYSIDLDKAEGEELDKACMATLAHIKENGQESFRIDENTPVELYDALVKAAEASGMTIENQEQLKEIMNKKREENREGNGDKDKPQENTSKPQENTSKPQEKEEPTLTSEQRDYLVKNGYVNDMKVEDVNNLKWSDLDKAKQELLTRDGLGPNQDAKTEEKKKEPEEKTEQKELSRSDALKNVLETEAVFDKNTQRYNLPDAKEFEKQIAGLSPAEQAAARGIREMHRAENFERDKAQKAGKEFDSKMEESFMKRRTQTRERAYEAIKKERGINPKPKKVNQTTLDPRVTGRDNQNT